MSKKSCPHLTISNQINKLLVIAGVAVLAKDQNLDCSEQMLEAALSKSATPEDNYCNREGCAMWIDDRCGLINKQR